MKIFFVIVLTMILCRAQGQVLVSLQVPSSGVVQKSSLWTMIITNAGKEAITLHVEVQLNDIANGSPVLSGVSEAIIIAPGTRQLSSDVLQPLLYTILSPQYAIDPSPNGLLPIGDFDACYSFMQHKGDMANKIAEECTPLRIEPLSPPQLLYPYDGTQIETIHPQLSWLAPMPAQLFTNLNYEVSVVEVLPNQAPADAVQQNLPLFQGQVLQTTNLLYPISAPALECGKQYAWRVVAKNGEARVAQSDTWIFSPKSYERVDSIEKFALPYTQLRNNNEGGYGIFTGELKFDYLNENGDTAWQVQVQDLSLFNASGFTLAMDSFPLLAGQNLIRYVVKDNAAFIDKHLYVLEVINTRHEHWRLRFEYRKPEE